MNYLIINGQDFVQEGTVVVEINDWDEAHRYV